MEKPQQLTSVDLLARLSRIRPFLKTNKRKPLRPPRIPILRQENPRNTTKPLEDLAEVVFLGELGHIGDSQRRQIVALVLAAHRRAGALTSTFSQMRRHIAPSSSSQPAFLGLLVVAIGATCTSRVAIFAHGRHGVFERTSGSEMLAIANPALDLLILQLRLDAILLGLLLLAVLLPRHARPEDDVLADGGRIEARPGGVAFFEAELGPGAAFGDAGVDGFFDDGGADAAGGFDLFAVVVEAVGDVSFGAVFVGGDLGRGEGVGVVEFFVVGPVLAARRC